MNAVALTFDSSTREQSVSGRVWVQRLTTAIPSLFLATDAAMKLLKVQAAVDGTVQLGFHESILVPLGIIQAVALILYLLPNTALFGAIIWTGYLGGAVAIHVRLANPLFTHVLSPVYVAVLLWGALWIRDARLRALVPLPLRRNCE